MQHNTIIQLDICFVSGINTSTIGKVYFDMINPFIWSKRIKVYGNMICSPWIYNPFLIIMKETTTIKDITWLNVKTLASVPSRASSNR